MSHWGRIVLFVAGMGLAAVNGSLTHPSGGNHVVAILAGAMVAISIIAPRSATQKLRDRLGSSRAAEKREAAWAEIEARRAERKRRQP
jgi:hypothetical protein